MERRGLIASILIALGLVLFTPTHQYKKDYGFGFMFKYEPNHVERQEAEGTLTENIKSVINHYKKEHAVGIPFLKDPLSINSFQRTFSGMIMRFQDQKVYGISRLKVEQLNTDLSEFKVRMKISMDELVVRGRYALTAYVSTVQGSFNMSIDNAKLDVDAELMLDELGHLQVRKIELDLTFGDLKTHFEKLGFLGKMFQGIVNAVGVSIFDILKPTILVEVESKLREIINSEARDIPQQFPTSINPVDKTLAHVRKLIKERNLDPVPLADYSTQNSKWSRFELYNGYLYGLSNIRRKGPLLLGFEENTIYMTLHIGVENLKGTYEWGWTAMRGVLSRRGQLSFKLDYVSIDIHLQQSANSNMTPIVDSVNVTLGPTQLTSDGIGAVHYILEMIFNVVPNVFRQRITDAAEYPISKVLEDELQKMNIESFIEAHV